MSHNIPDSSKKLLQYIINEIKLDESREEITSMAYIVLESVFNINKTDIILDRSVNLSKSKVKEFLSFLKRINEQEPIQYLVGEAEFYGRKFMVTPGSSAEMSRVSPGSLLRSYKATVSVSRNSIIL